MAARQADTGAGAVMRRPRDAARILSSRLPDVEFRTGQLFVGGQPQPAGCTTDDPVSELAVNAY
jgi:hypothetical protein